MSVKHHLQLVTDPGASSLPLAHAVAVVLRVGVDSVQVRDRAASASQLLATVIEIARVVRASDARLLVNDRVDVALAARAHGAHLPAASLPASAARALLEPWQLLGVSVHSVEEARAAAAGGADYVTFGHVYATPSHAGLEPRGIAELASVVEAVEIPVLAIGGIGPTKVEDVLATGCAGIAVISAILGAVDPGAAAATLRAAIDGSTASPRRPFPERRD